MPNNVDFLTARETGTNVKSFLPFAIVYHKCILADAGKCLSSVFTVEEMRQRVQYGTSSACDGQLKFDVFEKGLKLWGVGFAASGG